MIEWSESQLMIRDAVRRFVEEEVAPNVEALEHGDLPPYDILRKLYRKLVFGHRNRSAALAVDDRNRSAPVSLS